MAVTQNPADVANKWKQRLVASVPQIKAGVMAVTKSPMAAAAQQKAAYVAGVQRAADSGKWEAGLASVTLQQWQDATANKGAARIATGAEQATPKMTTFLQQLLPFTAQVKATVAAMPKGTVEDSIARATAAIRMMSQFRFSKKA